MAVTLCDAPRCNARALTWWALIRDNGLDRELYYCGHCSDERGPQMIAQDERWVQVADERETPEVVGPQTLVG